MSEVGRPHHLGQANGDRWETEAKMSNNPKQDYKVLRVAFSVSLFS